MAGEGTGGHNRRAQTREGAGQAVKETNGSKEIWSMGGGYRREGGGWRVVGTSEAESKL